MRASIPLILALAGCATDEPVQHPPPATLALSAVTAGGVATITLPDAFGAGNVAFFLSTDGLGDGPCSPDGACLGILDPSLLGFAQPDSRGDASLDWLVPGSAGDTITLQAAVQVQGGWQTGPIATRVVGSGIETSCMLDAVDGRDPQGTRRLPLLEDESISGFGLTLGGDDGSVQDAADRFAMEVPPGCRLDVFPRSDSDLSMVTASVFLDELTMLPFGELTTVRNDTDADVEAIVEFFLADTEQCVSYDLMVAYTCNNRPDVAVTIDVDGGDTCGEWTCTAMATDADDDPLTLSYAWDVDGTLVSTQSTYQADIEDGQTVRCSATVTDPWGDATTVSASAVAAQELSGVSAAVGGSARVGSSLSCIGSAEAACGELAWSYRWLVDGAEVGTASTLDTAGLSGSADITCEATATVDGLTATVTAPPITLAPTEVVLVGEGGQAGFSVGILGDLDGDGFGSFTLGAPTYSEIASYAGRVYVVDGNITTDTMPLADIEGATGSYVIDGVSGDYDLETMACGTWIYPDGCPRYIGLTETEGFDSGVPGSAFGYALGSGDFDGDGVGDLLTSAPFELITEIFTGRTYMMSGATLESAPIWDITAEDSMSGLVVDGECGRRRGIDLPIPDQFDVANGDLSGTAIAGLGDFNGDGLDDFAVQSLNAGDQESGMLYVVFGRDDGRNLDLAEFYSLGCDNSGGMGAGFELESLGVAFRGRNSSGNGLGAEWGHKVAPAGDFDGDGYDDVIFTGYYEPLVQLMAGRPEGGVVAPSIGVLPDDGWAFTTDGYSIGTNGSSGLVLWGFPSAGGGDMNADGLDDIVMGQIDYSSNSAVMVLFGRTNRGGSVVSENVTGDLGFNITGRIPNMRTSSGSAAVIGDINGDGLDDAAMGFPYANQVWVIYGRTDLRASIDYSELDNGTAGFVLRPDLDMDRFGWSLAGGDVNGDGLAELIVGASGSEDTDDGAAVVVYGHDITSDITQFGSAEDDLLVGSAAIDRIVGGRGDDILIGGGGVDVLYGGAGDDRLELTDGTFRRAHGGPGFDTLVLAPTASDIELQVEGRKIDGFEHIVLNGQALTVNPRDVTGLALTNTLELSGTGTVVIPPGDDWTDGGTVEEDGQTWRQYVQGRATVRIADSLSVDIPPTVQAATFTVAENPLDPVVGQIIANDPDGGPLFYAITGGPGADDMTMDVNTGTVSVSQQASFDFESDYELDLEITVTDDEGLSTVIDVEVILADVNEAPTFTSGGVEVVFGVEESFGINTDIIGAVLATDVDAGDVQTYSLEGPDAFRLTIDESGQIRIGETQTLDFEDNPTVLVDAVVTDVGGLTNSQPIRIDVYDSDVLEARASLTFATRNEVYEDTESTIASFEDCFDFGDADYESFNQRVTPPRFLPVNIPISARMEAEGELCLQFGMERTDGVIDATVPLELTFAVPDEVPAGGTFSLDTTWQPERDISYRVLFPTTEVYAGYSTTDFRTNVEFTYPDTLTTSVTRTIVDIGPSTDDWWQSHRVDGAVATSDRMLRWGLNTVWTAEREAGTITNTWGVDIDWIRYSSAFLEAIGYPFNANRGSYNMSLVGAYNFNYSYTVMVPVISINGATEVDAQMGLRGVNAFVVFEDGSSQSIELGGSTSLVLPQNGDLDGDGDVDIELHLFPDVQFTIGERDILNVGRSLEIWRGRGKLTDELGDVLQEMEIGPLYETNCSPPGVGCLTFAYDVEPGRNYCETAGFCEDDEIFYQLTGFNTQVIRGAIDVAGN